MVGSHTELQLQARWFAGQFGTGFLTTDNVPVRIVQFGVWNHEAGPDYVHAVVIFGDGPPVCGAIELDLDARDWERHGHATNPDYNNVVLHLFVNRSGPSFFSRTSENRNVPQVQLDIQNLGDLLQAPLQLGRCAESLRLLPTKEAATVLETAARHRMDQKSAYLSRLAVHQGQDEALFQGLAAALGYKANKLPFILLAQRLPLRSLLLEKQSLEALLFGAAGFLSDTELGALGPETRVYVRGLWEEWWSRRSGFRALTPRDWRMSGTRPANHPQRRLAALAEVVRHWPKIKALSKACDCSQVIDFFEGLEHRYWSHHYTLTSRRVEKRMALVGAVRTADILANVLVPFAMIHDPGLWDSYCTLRAPPGNSALNTATKRIFGEPRPELTKKMVHQQGLLQIYSEFCLQDRSACHECLFPEQLRQY